MHTRTAETPLSHSRGYSLARGGAADDNDDDGFTVVLITGDRSKKPEGLSSKPAYSVGITGQSSSRGTCVTPNVYLRGVNRAFTGICSAATQLRTGQTSGSATWAIGTESPQSLVRESELCLLSRNDACGLVAYRTAR